MLLLADKKGKRNSHHCIVQSSVTVLIMCPGKTTPTDITICNRLQILTRRHLRSIPANTVRKPVEHWQRWRYIWEFIPVKDPTIALYVLKALPGLPVLIYIVERTSLNRLRMVMNNSLRLNLFNVRSVREVF